MNNKEEIEPGATGKIMGSNEKKEIDEVEEDVAFLAELNQCIGYLQRVEDEREKGILSEEEKSALRPIFAQIFKVANEMREKETLFSKGGIGGLVLMLKHLSSRAKEEGLEPLPFEEIINCLTEMVNELSEENEKGLEPEVTGEIKNKGMTVEEYAQFVEQKIKEDNIKYEKSIDKIADIVDKYSIHFKQLQKEENIFSKEEENSMMHILEKYSALIKKAKDDSFSFEEIMNESSEIVGELFKMYGKVITESE